MARSNLSVRIRPRPPWTMSLRPSLLLLAPIVCLAACRSAEEFAQAADDEAYGLIAEHRAELFSIEDAFTIEPRTDSLRQRILRGEEPDIETLSLQDCLEIAAENSRTYQTRKEALYLTALDLARQQFNFGVVPSAGADASVSGSGGNAETQSFGLSGALTRVLETGAVIVADVGLSFLKIVGDGDGFDAVSDLGVSVTQPLLRGFGRRIFREPLTQAERTMVYEARAFERFRRTFAIDVVDRAYGILLQQNAVVNEEANIAALEVLRERNEALARAGRLSDIQVDQARQDELRSRTRLINEQQRLNQQLDQFKLFLGLPIDAAIGVDPTTLDELVELGASDVEVSEEEAVETALARRLDYLTTLDQIIDTERRVAIAANALKAGLDLSASADFSSPSGRPLSGSTDDVNWSLGLDLDLPVGRLPERNAYRAALITHQVALRNADQDADQIRTDLRDDLRVLEATRQSYENNKTEIALAGRRVESAQLSLEAGRASTRDLLEAQEDLLGAKNNATRSLIDYALARLDLYLDMEVLVVDEAYVGADETLLQREIP